jgi:hypothetical protein
MPQTAALPPVPALVPLSPDLVGSTGRESVERLVGAVRRALPRVNVLDPQDIPVPGTAATEGHDGARPAIPSVLRLVDRLGVPSVLMPLTLSSFYAGGQLAAPAARARYEARVAQPLGPDRLLARALLVRLRQAGAQWGDAVVLAAGELSGPAALAAAEHAAAMLASEWGSPVSLASTSPLAPSVQDAVSDLRATGAHRVFVASYLLTPGPLADVVAGSARQAGAAGVAEVLAGHRLLVELIVQRYRTVLASWGQGGPV